MYRERERMLIQPAIGYITGLLLALIMGAGESILPDIKSEIGKLPQGEIYYCKWQTNTEAVYNMSLNLANLTAMGNAARKQAANQTAAGGAAPLAARTQPAPPSPATQMSAGGAAPAYAALQQPIYRVASTAPYRPPAPAPVYRAPAPAPAPVYRAPAPVYQPPMNFAPAPQIQNFAPAPPPEPPRPQFAPGGRQEFLNMFSPEQQQLTEQQFLSGDSDYTQQMGMYQRALDDFVRRITGRIEGFEQDAKDSIAGNVKNEAMSLDQLGADFGARGLAFSGLWDTSRNKMKDRYTQGRTNIDKNKTTNVQNARNEEADYKAENEISRGNAKRSALMRMAAQQSLKDANW